MHIGKAEQVILANLEHEFRILRDSIRLGSADGQYERHLRIPGRPGRPDSYPLARRTAYRPRRAADHRSCQRPYLGPPRAPSTLLPRRRDPEFNRPRSHATLVGPVDGCRSPLDSGCLDHHQHGAVSLSSPIYSRNRKGPAALPCRACLSELERSSPRPCRGC